MCDAAMKAWRRHVFSTWALLLLTGGILWGNWLVDLRHGDTANHYRRSVQWLQAGPADRMFAATSPLYTVYLAAVAKAFPEPEDAIFVHRALIVLACAAAFFALLRQILPRPWAWLVAAWWVALPVNWHAEYEVHFFSFALLAAAAALAGGRTAWHRGGAVALLALLSFTLRNEYLPAVGLFAACLAYAEWRGRREATAAPARAWRWVAYVLPAVALCGLTAWLLSGNEKQRPWHYFRAALEHRHRINLVQVYPLGYIQRHDDWKGDPWGGGGTLMERDFHMQLPTFGEAFRANPKAIFEHIRWNLRLIPAGLQLGLFNRYGDNPSPEFSGRATEHLRNPWPLTIITVLLWGLGAWMLVRFQRRHGRLWLHGWSGGWVWIFLLCCVPTAIVGIVTQRPRPNYIFPLLMLLMAFAGVSARLLYGEVRRRLRSSTRTWRPVMPALAVVLIVFFSGRNGPAFVHRPTLEDVRRVQPFQKLVTRKHGVFCTNAPHSYELGCYAGLNQVNDHKLQSWPSVLKRTEGGASFGEALGAVNASELFLKDLAQLPPAVQAWRSAPAADGWRRLGGIENGAESWEFWSREVPEAARQKKTGVPALQSID